MLLSGSIWDQTMYGAQCGKRQRNRDFFQVGNQILLLATNQQAGVAGNPDARLAIGCPCAVEPVSTANYHGRDLFVDRNEGTNADCFAVALLSNGTGGLYLAMGLAAGISVVDRNRMVLFQWENEKCLLLLFPRFIPLGDVTRSTFYKRLMRLAQN